MDERHPKWRELALLQQQHYLRQSKFWQSSAALDPDGIAPLARCGASLLINVLQTGMTLPCRKFVVTSAKVLSGKSSLYGSVPFFTVCLLCSPSRHAEKNPAADEQAEVSFPLSPVRPELSTLSLRQSGVASQIGRGFVFIFL
jgi:hypothetical protein